MTCRHRWVAAALSLVGVLAAACGGAVTEGASLVREQRPLTTAGEAPTSIPAAPTVTEAPPPPPPTAPPPPGALAGTDAPAVVSPTGVMLPVVERREADVLVSTPCGRTVPLGAGAPVPEAVVVLDSGHGGPEPGAVGPTGLREKDVNDAVTAHAKSALEAAGVPTALTRTGDYRMTLGARARVVEAFQPRAFVSIHHNAEPDGPWPGPGSETYYQVGGPADDAAASKRLAGLVHEELVRTFSAYDVDWSADRDAGAKYRRNVEGDDYYGILRLTQGTPAVLSEAAFVSNPSEEALLRRADVQQAEGEAIARAVLRFLTTDDPGSGYVEPYPRESPAGGGGGPSNCIDPALG